MTTAPPADFPSFVTVGTTIMGTRSAICPPRGSVCSKPAPTLPERGCRLWPDQLRLRQGPIAGLLEHELLDLILLDAVPVVDDAQPGTLRHMHVALRIHGVELVAVVALVDLRTVGV